MTRVDHCQSLSHCIDPCMVVDVSGDIDLGLLLQDVGNQALAAAGTDGSFLRSAPDHRKPLRLEGKKLPLQILRTPEASFCAEGALSFPVLLPHAPFPLSP